MENFDLIEDERQTLDEKVRSLLDRACGSGMCAKTEPMLFSLQSLMHESMSSVAQSIGARYLNHLWKTMLDDMPHRLNKETELSILLGISRTFDFTGDWEHALEKYTQALELASALKEREIEANIFRWMGHVNRNQGRWRQAIRCNKKSVNICRTIHYPTGEAYARNNLGTIYFELGELDKAQEHYQSALAIAKERGEARLIAQIYNNLGIIADIKGEYEQAILSYHQALIGYEKEADMRGMAQTCYNLALSFGHKDDEAMLTKHLEISSDLAKEIGERNLMAMICLKKAHLSAQRNSFAIAHSFKDFALKTLTELGNRRGVADAYRIEGIIYHRQAEYEGSESSFKKGIDLNRELRNPLGLAETYLEYGIHLKERGRQEEALAALGESRKLFSRFEALKKEELIESLMGSVKSGNR